MIGSLCIYQGDYEYMIVTYLTHSSTVILSPGLLSCKTRVATQYSPGVVWTVTITMGDMGQATLGIEKKRFFLQNTLYMQNALYKSPFTTNT